jgi:N,N'-diacetyllegionaminate synthase
MSKVFIIAEAGVNHNGDPALAKAMIEEAVAAGVNAVKFQTFKADRIASRGAPKAAYQTRTSPRQESQVEMLRRLELSAEVFEDLSCLCRAKEVAFLSSAFDKESVDVLTRLGVGIWKIPSGEITNLPLLRRIGSLGQPVILSTGMCSLGEIEAALGILTMAGAPRDSVTVLHCHTEYPTPYGDVNLRAMCAIRDAFQIAVGYSDHTCGWEIPVAAVALGARVIEKHFTLDRNMPGPDHHASLEPDEIKAMVQAIRHVEQALGDGIKRPTDAETKNREVVRKSIVASTSIRQGQVFTENNLTTKRPGTGLSPMRWDELIGKAAPRDFGPDEIITLS